MNGYIIQVMGIMIAVYKKSSRFCLDDFLCGNISKTIFMNILPTHLNNIYVPEKIHFVKSV